ncbi:hypothetical protein ACIBSV_37260 [Embleya sp. NPDC050154]|uniref:hypothetical protein n=1 Tax=Embleya sp. NPDC050154 TaxID=3363988 RepID=UPI00378A8FC6
MADEFRADLYITDTGGRERLVDRVYFQGRDWDDAWDRTEVHLKLLRLADGEACHGEFYRGNAGLEEYGDTVSL